MSEFTVEYRRRLLHLLSHLPTVANHTNVLMHVQGYFRPYLSSDQRQALAQLIEQYRLGNQPLHVPIAQITEYLAEFPNDYLAQQRYFAFIYRIKYQVIYRIKYQVMYRIKYQTGRCLVIE